MTKVTQKSSVAKASLGNSQTGPQKYYAEKQIYPTGQSTLLDDSVEDYAIFLLDPNGHIASWSPGAEKFKGYTPKEIIGKHFSVFYSPEDKRNKKPDKELLESMKYGRIEYEGWRIRKDGSKFWANVVMTALYDGQGNHCGFAKVTRDLTERKKYEDKLFKTNKKLEASYRELQDLNLAKDEFVSLASHQLRTPATGVKQYLGLLLEGYMGTLTEQQTDCLQKAYESNDRQIEIINDLLQVAQLDAGKVILKKSQLPIGDMVEDVIDEQVDVFKNKRQRIILRIPKEPVTALVDGDRLRMVIENLIDNASKYTPDKGEITVTISKNKKTFRIIVQDTGVGIKKSDIPKLFEKFTRLSNPRTRNVSGSGLGLYWAHKIVELHKGNIKVESELNKGTCFIIILPLDSNHA